MGRLVTRTSIVPVGLVDGASATITGTGFGTNSATVTSLKNAVDAATNNTELYNISGMTAWSNIGAESGTRSTRASTTLPLYGTKSLRCANAGLDGRFGVGFDTGGTITDIFYRDYCRIEQTGGATAGQWKMFRLGAQNEVSDDVYRNLYIADWTNTGFDFIRTQSGNGFNLGGAATLTDYSATDFATAFSVWYEREIRVVPGSQGGSDGRVELRLRRVSDFVEVCNITTTTMQMYTSSETHFYRYLILQNYQGNGTYDDGSGTTTVYMDGNYISNGSQKRVYLGNASTWAACTQREIQDWTSWANTSIGITVRKGTLSSLTGAYGYVVDGSGSVNSSGYTVS
jgi:hypothetical protein